MPITEAVLRHLPSRNLRTAYWGHRIKMGEGAYIDRGVYFYYPWNISCGKNVMFGRDSIVNGAGGLAMGSDILMGPRCYIWTSNHDCQNHNSHILKSVTIGSNVWIGANVCICPGASIGNNCVIGMGSVVTGDIPSNSMASGNPAQVKKAIPVPAFESGKRITLNIRKTVGASSWRMGQPNTVESIETFDSKRVCMVVMDAWAKWEDPSLQRQTEELLPGLVRLVEWAKRNKICVITDSSGKPVAEGLSGLPSSLPSGIDTIIYSGFHSNSCILFKPSGALQMSRMGYRVMIARDAVAALETPETLPDGANRTVIDMFERFFGGSINEASQVSELPWEEAESLQPMHIEEISSVTSLA